MEDIETTLKEMHMGRLIQMLSHKLKRDNYCQCQDADQGLTPIQRHVLNFILLETLHRNVFQKDIEEEFQIRKSTVTGILKLMEQNGFIKRQNDPKDGRLKRLIPTEKAEALRPEILEHICQTENYLTRGISEEQLLLCKKTLYQMLQNLT